MKQEAKKSSEKRPKIAGHKSVQVPKVSKKEMCSAEVREPY